MTPDYKDLYGQAQAKLTCAEQTAREHSEKAARLDEIEAAQQTEAERATARATTLEQQLATVRRTAVEASIRAAATQGRRADRPAGGRDPRRPPRRRLPRSALHLDRHTRAHPGRCSAGAPGPLHRLALPRPTDDPVTEVATALDTLLAR